MSFNYGRIDRNVFRRLEQARRTLKESRVYTVVDEVEYDIKDMLHFDGETIEEWIDKDLRRRAREAGYDIPPSLEEEETQGVDASFRVWFNLRSDKKADGTVVYKTSLMSNRVLTKEG